MYLLKISMCFFLPLHFLVCFSNRNLSTLQIQLYCSSLCLSLLLYLSILLICYNFRDTHSRTHALLHNLSIDFFCFVTFVGFSARASWDIFKICCLSYSCQINTLSLLLFVCLSTFILFLNRLFCLLLLTLFSFNNLLE